MDPINLNAVDNHCQAPAQCRGESERCPREGHRWPLHDQKQQVYPTIHGLMGANPKLNSFGVESNLQARPEAATTQAQFA